MEGDIMYGIKDIETGMLLYNIYGNPMTFDTIDEVDLWLDTYGDEEYLLNRTQLEIVDVEVKIKLDATN